MLWSHLSLPVVLATSLMAAGDSMELKGYLVLVLTNTLATAATLGFFTPGLKSARCVTRPNTSACFRPAT